MRRAADWSGAKNGVVKKRRREPRRRSKFRFQVPDEFKRAHTQQRSEGAYRVWRHRVYPLRVVRFLSSLEDREHWYVQRRQENPSGAATWDNLDDFTRPAPAFRCAVQAARQYAQDLAARQGAKPR